jgi:hypothetical protein
MPAGFRHQLQSQKHGACPRRSLQGSWETMTMAIGNFTHNTGPA